MNFKKLTMLVGFLITTALGACSTPDRNEHARVTTGAGVVDRVEVVKKDSNAVVGTIAGAVIGGVLGSQVGGGRGKTIGTIAGTAGGAIAGHEIQKRINKDEQVKLIIRMNDGSYQTIIQDTDAGVREGDRVQIERGRVVRL
jgi:outer membrane lipoprotein SlyB